MVAPPLHVDAARFGLAPVRVRSALAALAEFSGNEGLSASIDLILRRLLSLAGEQPGPLFGPLRLGGRGGARAGARPPARPRPGGRADLPRESGVIADAGRGPHLRHRCRRVLATDLAWPGYLTILGEELARAGTELVLLPLRSAVLFDKFSAKEVADRVAEEYTQRGCDGLFLPAVSHHGVRIPLGLIRRLEVVGLPLRFFAVDAAQVPGHLPPGQAVGLADFVIAGCHKWLGSFQTLGVGVGPGTPAIGDAVAAEARGLDPLLDFLEDVRSGRTEPFGETVGLVPLFTARAAIAALASGPAPGLAFANRLANAALASEAASNTDWTPICLHPSLRTGILLLRARSRADRRTPGGVLRERFLGTGVVLTAYDGGFVRLRCRGGPCGAWSLTCWSAPSEASSVFGGVPPLGSRRPTPAPRRERRSSASGRPR